MLKTISGSAPLQLKLLDSLKFVDIAGTIAGDNTVFILARKEEKAKEIVQKIKKMLVNRRS